jgi:hypothetical protein
LARLLEQIPAAVRAARIASPVYCLLICYCGEDFPASWPPFLVLGAEAERQRIIKEGHDVKYFLWAPDEMRNCDANHEVGLGDAELIGKCRVHAQLMSAANGWDACRRILESVAKQLNDYPWRDNVPITDDFIVAAVEIQVSAICSRRSGPLSRRHGWRFSRPKGWCDGLGQLEPAGDRNGNRES